MLRAVLVGLLSVSAVACKSSDDAPRSQPAVAAGKVVEVTGTVTVRHGDVARPLAKGETVEGDDIVETGADGNVIIELTHNLARWELGANKKSKVAESAAWGLAKKSGDVTTVEQQSAAAGRHAERSAADTSVSAPAPVAAAAPAAAPPAAEPAKTSPPPPPPPAPTPRRRAAATADQDVGRIGTLEKKSGGGGAGAANVTAQLEAAPAPMSPADADKAAMDVVLANEKSIKACLTKDAQTVSVTIKVGANGTATAVVSGKADLPAGVQRCVKAAIAKLTFAKAATTVKLEVSR